MATYKSATKSCFVINKLEYKIPRDMLEIIKSFAYTETEKCVNKCKTKVLSNITTMWEEMDEYDIESYSGVNDGRWIKYINSTWGKYIKGSIQFKCNTFEELEILCLTSKSCLTCGNYREPVYIYSERNKHPYDVLTIENAPNLICNCRISIFM